MAAAAEARIGRVSPPSIDSSLAATLLPTVLSLIAGSVDTISFLGLGGLFAAHVTGNLVLLAAHLVAGDAAPIAAMLSVPIFMAALAVTRLSPACASTRCRTTRTVVPTTGTSRTSLWT